MTRPAIIALFLLISACTTQPPQPPAAANEPGAQSDADLRKLIVGGWIVSAESDDYLRGFSETLWEEFTEDGAEILHIHEDESCVKEIETENARWSIVDGILVTDYDDGSSDHDKIVSITDQSMTLKFEDGLTGIMNRAAACGTNARFDAAASFRP